MTLTEPQWRAKALHFAIFFVRLFDLQNWINRNEMKTNAASKTSEEKEALAHRERKLEQLLIRSMQQEF